MLLVSLIHAQMDCSAWGTRSTFLSLNGLTLVSFVKVLRLPSKAIPHDSKNWIAASCACIVMPRPLLPAMCRI